MLGPTTLPPHRLAPARREAARKLLIGLIGAGIQHSLSPAMHEQEARQQGLQLHYQLIDVERSADGAAALPRLIDAARTMAFAGLNITYPCKQAVIPLLDALSDEAAAMGAVNTVVFDGGRAIGHNTDGSGLGLGLSPHVARRPTCRAWCCWAPAAPARRSRTPCCAWAHNS